MIAFDARAAKALVAGNHLTFESMPGLRLRAAASTRTQASRCSAGVGRRQSDGDWPRLSPAAQFRHQMAIADADADDGVPLREAGQHIAQAVRAARRVVTRRLCGSMTRTLSRSRRTPGLAKCRYGKRTASSVVRPNITSSFEKPKTNMSLRPVVAMVFLNPAAAWCAGRA